MAAARPLRSSPTSLMPGDHPFDCLMRGTRDLRGPAVRAHLTVGRNDVHPFPRRLQWKLPGRCGDWLTPPPSPPGPQPPGRHDERGMGTFNWPPAETSTWPHTGTFSWPRTRGTPEGEGSSVNLLDGLAEPSTTDVGGPHAHRHSHPPGSGPQGPSKSFGAN